MVSVLLQSSHNENQECHCQETEDGKKEHQADCDSLNLKTVAEVYVSEQLHVPHFECDATGEKNSFVWSRVVLRSFPRSIKLGMSIG